MENFLENFETSFDALYKNGAFLTCKDNRGTNTMTISWGSVGYMWRKPVFMALVRTSRYTYEFLNNSTEFTISIPKAGELKEALKICGSKSGRDVNKVKEANIKLLLGKKVNCEVVEGCNTYYECKKIFVQPMDTNNFFDENIRNTFYNEKEVPHVLFFGEIVEKY